MNQSEKLSARIKDLQKREGKGKPILLTIMVLVGDDGIPMMWTVDKINQVEGLQILTDDKNML